MKNIMLPLEITKSKVKTDDIDNTERAKSLIKLMRLNGFENFLPKELSGGMKSRVSIARSLITDPQILLMDEAFGSLDELTREKMNEELISIKYKTGKTIVFVTHSISEAVFLSDQVIVLSHRPAEITKIVSIDLPHPRNLQTKNKLDYIEMVQKLRNILAQKNNINENE